MFSGNRTARKSQKPIDEEWQRQDHERVQLERRNRMEMQQLIARAR